MHMPQTSEQQTTKQQPFSNGVRNIGRICGAIGLVLTLSTPLTWLLTEQIGLLVYIKLLLSICCIGFYIITNADVFNKFMGSKSTGLLALSAASTLLMISMVVAINYVAFKHDKEFDFTREGIYTLSPQTTTLLKNLQQDVHLVAFYANYDPLYASVKDTLERYAHDAPKLSYEMIDPQSRPDLVEKYQVTEHGPRIIVGAAGHEGRIKDISEQELTGGIAKVTQQQAKTIYVLTGHNEGDFADAEHAEGYKLLGDALAAEGYHVDTLNFMFAAKSNGTVNTKQTATLDIPKNADALIVMGAKHGLLAPEVEAITTYLNNGGRLIAMLEPHVTSNLEPLYQTWQINVHDDLIVDSNPLNRLLGLGAAAAMVQPSNTAHPIVKDLTVPAIMVTARSLGITHDAGPTTSMHIDTQHLAQTADSAWGETHMGKDGTASRDSSDNLPPLYVAIAAQAQPLAEGKHGGRLVVFGDSEWVNNRYLSMQGNQDFVLNAIGWAVEQDDKITIRPKNRSSSQLFLSGEQIGKLKFFSIDVLPVLTIAMGLGIVLIRRQR